MPLPEPMWTQLKAVIEKKRAAEAKKKREEEEEKARLRAEEKEAEDRMRAELEHEERLRMLARLNAEEGEVSGLESEEDSPFTKKPRSRPAVSSDDDVQILETSSKKRMRTYPRDYGESKEGIKHTRYSKGGNRRPNMKHNLDPTGPGKWAQICRTNAAEMTKEFTELVHRGELPAGAWDGQPFTPEQWNAGGVGDFQRDRFKRKAKYAAFARAEKKKRDKELSVKRPATRDLEEELVPDVPEELVPTPRGMPQEELYAQARQKNLRARDIAMQANADQRKRDRREDARQAEREEKRKADRIAATLASPAFLLRQEKERMRQLVFEREQERLRILERARLEILGRRVRKEMEEAKENEERERVEEAQRLEKEEVIRARAMEAEVREAEKRRKEAAMDIRAKEREVAMLKFNQAREKKRTEEALARRMEEDKEIAELRERQKATGSVPKSRKITAEEIAASEKRVADAFLLRKKARRKLRREQRVLRGESPDSLDVSTQEIELSESSSSEEEGDSSETPEEEPPLRTKITPRKGKTTLEEMAEEDELEELARRGGQ